MINKQSHYWNKVASKKAFTTALDLQLFAELIVKDALIVDYGCGYGRTLDILHQQGYTNIIGFDFAEKMIKRGKKEFPHLDLRITNGNKINYADNTVDVVLLFAVLTCIIDDDLQLQLIAEIERILKPGGLVYINDFLVNTDDRNRQRYTKFSKKYKNHGVFELPDGALLRHHSAAWITFLTKHFKQIVFKKTIFTTMNGNISNGFVYLGRV